MTAAMSFMIFAPAIAQKPASSGADLSAIVEALEKTQTQARLQVAYQVIREYRLYSTKSSAGDSRVVAEVDFSPPNAKNYKIQTASGNNRGQQVVRRVLDHEVQASGDLSGTALTRSNYGFTYIGETVLDGQSCYLLGLKPKRKEKDLISGRAWVDKNSYFVRRVEGEIAKPPSWWLKRVWVTLAFADFQGSWLQSKMEAVADVRMLGSHTLTSRILDYRAADVVASGLSSAALRSARRP